MCVSGEACILEKLDPLKLKVQVFVNHKILVLGIELWSCIRSALLTSELSLQSQILIILAIYEILLGQDVYVTTYCKTQWDATYLCEFRSNSLF